MFSSPTLRPMSTVALNPDNYLNHLPPAEAFQFEVARNVYVAVLGALIWDILVYIPEDIRILCLQNGLRPVNICFVTSRLFTLCYILLAVLEKTTPINNCNGLVISTGCCLVIAVSSTHFLFLRRVQAVYAEYPWIKRFFFVFWVVTGSTEITVAVGVRATHLPGTRYCFDSSVQHYVVLGGFMPLIFDTLVFLAISYKIASTFSVEDSRVSWGTIISGKALPRLSRAVLQGGQQYYLLSSIFFIALVILLLLPSLPPIYHNILAFPTTFISASMACRVYRNIKLLDYYNDGTLAPVSVLRFTGLQTATPKCEPLQVPTTNTTSTQVRVSMNARTTTVTSV